MKKKMSKYLYDVRKEHFSHMSSHMTVVCTSFVFAEFRLIFAQFFLALF